MVSWYERFITSHLGTTEPFYGSRMGGWATDSPGRAFISSILRPRFCGRILGWEDRGRGGCELEWSTSFKMAEILFVVYSSSLLNQEYHWYILEVNPSGQG